ncbi:MAG TPA: LysE family translocator [Blastocatellia bacterium]|nr:LysE family translocator [Blastocatellia bacterium]
MPLKVILVFAMTEFLLSLTPGPAVLLVVSQGMRYGAVQSIGGTLGILTGNALYFALSAVGLGTLLMASASLFTAIKWVGAAYLIYVGIRMLLAREEPEQSTESSTLPARRSMKLFTQGLITQLSNPKAVLFFTALLPQFISSGGDVTQQLVWLGVVSIVVECPVLLAYGWLAERGRKLLPAGRLAVLPNRIAGGCLIGVGVGLASMKRG